MKKNLFLVVCLLSVSLVAVAQEKSEGTYIQNPGNPKFEGTYVFDDGQQRFVMTLNNRERVRLKKGDHRFTDLLEGNISYTKSGKTIMTKNMEAPHIQFGMEDLKNPTVVYATYIDKERSQSGTITLTLDPKTNTVVFKSKKDPGGVHVVTDEASRQLAEQIMRSHSRPLAIPDSLVLKKQ